MSDLRHVQQRQLLKGQQRFTALAVSFKDSSIFNLVFEKCIKFLYISYLLKVSGKYDIYYNGLCEDSFKFT